MKITVLGSLGNINRNYLPRLIADGHDVTVITSSQDRIAAIHALGAEAAVGSNRDVDFLTTTFQGSDVVYLMISGINPMSGADMWQAAIELSENYKTAVQSSGVKNVVNLSSIGADNPNAGILYCYHFGEDALNSLDGVNVVHIRPVGFFNNLFADMQSLKTQQTIFSQVSADIMRGWVSPVDIADVVYALISNTPAGKSVKFVVSDWGTGNDWLKALAENGIEAKYQKIPAEAIATNMRKIGFHEDTANRFVQMNRAGENADEFYASLRATDYHLGKVKLGDFAKVFAETYKKSI
ncbi:putative nucleoside-diphosphate sugar epimerase [Desulfosporosinus acidiphilus SJ4]|uniref:Putative nucleoside-diphosphate sugar epimerase n=1 Tax=Desulfosporosinus acidiphilus (strain DSM 22704 / JCM 16185 / SJ4) TaxID=646529 RepID=I4D6M8_DESAJ|nr:NAD(P)H-binding protein [Desulfosporosinus acidiphilus]AFM41452.1 putative nucleoside-diphosphate sugar epimerase [Desulfosporosinus acidiphilus SJ4]